MLVAEQFPRLRSRWAAYALAAVSVALATLGFLYSSALLSSAYLIPFMLAVAISTLFGLGPGLTAVALALIATNWLAHSAAPKGNFAIVTALALANYLIALAAARFSQELLRRTGRDQKVKLALYRLFTPRSGEGPPESLKSPSFLGRLDGGQKGEIYGWALDANNSSVPAKITVYANSRPIGETLAVYYRPDVGQHAFYFDLAQNAGQNSSTRIDARLPDGNWLPNSPITIEASPPRPRRSETVLFMHIAKTAGTAFREAIVENYRESEVAYIYPHPPGFLPCHWELLPLEQRAKFQLVIGHFQYGVHSLLPQPSTYVTIVRDPVKRVLSHYYYLLETVPEIAREGSSMLDLPDLLEQRRTVNLDNLVVRCFSGLDEKQAPPGHIDRQVYELAVHHLRTNFAFVGYQDRADEAYSALQKRFDWRPRASLDTVNRGTRPVSNTDPKVISAIERFNSWDCRLYAEISKLFP